MKILIYIIAKILSILPLRFLKALVELLGRLFFIFPSKRRQIILSNLAHAFPKKTDSWRYRIAKTSCQRTLEMGLFAIVAPILKENRILKQFQLTPKALEIIQKAIQNKRPTVIFVPHFSLIESITFFPKLYANAIPETGVIYRPLRNPALDRWIKNGRKRFGLKLLSRKEGFWGAMDILRKGGAVAILSDQNAGKHGVLTTFFDRVVSTSDLPGLLAKKFSAQVIALCARRTGFWKAELDIEMITDHEGNDSVEDANITTLKINQWLEKKLTQDEDFCMDWLWLHDRWRTQDEPQERFCLRERKNIITQTIEFKKEKYLPRRTRIWIRFPNWLGDCVMAIPVIQTLRQSRPDAEVTLFAQSHFIPLLQKLEIAERVVSIPEKGLGYFNFFYKLRAYMPDVFVLMTNSERSDFEAFLTRAPQRFGIARHNKKRFFLTHPWYVPENIVEEKIHQTHFWNHFFRYYGMNRDLDLSPIHIKFESQSTLFSVGRPIGMICGSEHSPSKRWPMNHWKTLIKYLLKEYPSTPIHLFGTQKDASITAAIKDDFSKEPVIDFSGKTDLITFAKKLSLCSLVICNDTGGMHLANLLGVPVVALFGPTNPIQTGPIFNGPKLLLKPQNSSFIGDITAQQVFLASKKLLE